MKQRDLAEFVLSSLSWRHREALNQEAPAKLKVPSGRMVALSYPADGPPILAVKVQEVFGWMTCPTIARGRCTVVLHLLDPARRPLQVTQDLASFWTGTWLEVCKEMRRRYPKHRWPDDPGQALPSLKTTKRR